MTKKIRFTKMHGAGNDYIYVNTMVHPIDTPQTLAIRWSAPHTGIGSDGLVLVGASEVADFSMRIFNADGSEAMMCGNASRCIGKYVYEEGLTRKEAISLETLSGIKLLRLKVKDETVEEVTVDMGIPDISEIALTLEVDGKQYEGTVVSMGNPHLVIFTDNIDSIDLSTIGPVLERHPHFPDRTNVEFAQILPTGAIRMRVWERGSGITLACGTGACATAVAAALGNRSKRETRVIMDGGSLDIAWNESTGTVHMTGDAINVFEGIISL